MESFVTVKRYQIFFKEILVLNFSTLGNSGSSKLLFITRDVTLSGRYQVLEHYSMRTDLPFRFLGKYKDFFGIIDTSNKV